MKTIILRMMICCGILLSPFSGMSYADDLETLTAAWKPTFGDGFISLVVKNTSEVPIKISPRAIFQYTNSLQNVDVSFANLDRPGTLHATIVVIGSPRTIAPPNLKGPSPVPLDIAPGESKTLKFPVTADFIAAAKEAKQAEFLISNKEIISKIMMTGSKNVWKEIPL